MTNPSSPFFLKTAAAITTVMLITLSGCSYNKTSDAGNTDIKQYQTSLGKVFTDSKGMSLYTFAKDKYNVSNCNNGCAVKWPPLYVKNAQTSNIASGRFSVITRSDNSKQWALDGKPLYKWFKDKRPGDTTGNGIKSVWFIAKSK